MVRPDPRLHDGPDNDGREGTVDEPVELEEFGQAFGEDGFSACSSANSVSSGLLVIGNLFDHNRLAV